MANQQQYLSTIFIEGVENEFEVVSYAEFTYTARERALDYFRSNTPNLMYNPVEYIKTIKYSGSIDNSMLVNTDIRI